MKKLPIKRLIGLILFGITLLVAVPLIALAQGTPDEQKSLFLRFVQDRLSTPERQIRISNIDGVLSSDASINEITISDAEGVWLRVSKAKINWNQGALFTGRLEINTLSADEIDVIRNPKPVGGVADLPPPEAKGLEVPQLPVAVILKQLSVPKVSFGEQVFGLGSQISVNGSLTLDGGSLDSTLAIKRLDGPGGALDLAVKYAKDTTNIDLALTVTEPKDGMIANLLDIAGRPDVHLSLTGSGPVANLKTQLTLDAGGKRALTGVATVNQAAAGFAIRTDLRGPIADLVAPAYHDFFGAETALTADALLPKAGGIAINALQLTGGQLTLNASGATGPDWFLTALTVNGSVTPPAGQKAVLPVAGADTRIDGAQLAVNYGGASAQAWSGKLLLTGFENAVLAAKTVQVTATGVAANLDKPAQRRITFNGDGVVDGVTAKSADVQAALGDSLGFGVAGLWNAGQPVQLAQLRLAGKALSLDMNGSIDKAVFNGNVAIKTTSLAPFSGVAGRNLSGALDLSAKGTISPLVGGFDLALDGTGTNLSIANEVADRVLAGQVRLTGGVARNDTGLQARQFRIANPQVDLRADGSFATGAANFTFNFDLADLGLLTPQAKGALSVAGSAKGQQGNIAFNLDATVPAGSLAGRTLQNGAVGFAGTLAKGALNGNLTGGAFLDGFKVALASGITVDDTQKHLSALNFTAGGTSITGDLTQRKDGLYEGQLKLAASDVTTAAALVLVKATGAANADIALNVAGGKQNASISATVRNFNAADVTVGAADIQASLADLFGVPVVDGSATGSNISAASVDVATLTAKATRTGQTTAFAAMASLKTNTDIAVNGSLAPLGQGYRLALDQATLKQGTLSAKLAAPAALAVNGKTVTMDNIRFDVGGGQVTATGSAGDALN
ncbi:MAG: gramicidin biosynthesis grst protein, partial [Hyphomicrobiales bacterium]|nr:gramicidin biosynthesis grst protein [Hyphomicrobiales bacterium]